MKPRKLKTKPSIFRKLLILSSMIIVGFFLLVLLLTPLRTWGAGRYLEKGDEKLLNLEYISAEIEYQKAALLTPLSPNISAKINLVKESEKNLLALKTFLLDKDVRGAINDFKAIDTESDPARLIALSRDFINKNQPQMAVVAAKKANSLKENYRDGLLYLAIAFDRAARVSTIRQASADYLLEQSEKYLQLAHESDPAYFASQPAP